MTVTEAIQYAFQYGQGKPVAPAVGTPKYNALLLIADSMQQQWANEPSVEWESLTDDVTLAGTITATNTVELDDEIKTLRKGSDDPVLVGTTAYKLVSTSKLYRYRNNQVVAKAGRNLKFPSAFASDSALIGSSVTVPAVLYPERITAGTDDVQVDDPWWLVYMMAAEFARNNIIKAPQFDNLLAYAENSMNKMKEDNGSAVEEIETVGYLQGESW
jgi:hypothetical protein